jgi:hypothetical protein
MTGTPYKGIILQDSLVRRQHYQTVSEVVGKGRPPFGEGKPGHSLARLVFVPGESLMTELPAALVGVPSSRSPGRRSVRSWEFFRTPWPTTMDSNYSLGESQCHSEGLFSAGLLVCWRILTSSLRCLCQTCLRRGG